MRILAWVLPLHVFFFKPFLGLLNCFCTAREITTIVLIAAWIIYMAWACEIMRVSRGTELILTLESWNACMYVVCLFMCICATEVFFIFCSFWVSPLYYLIPLLLPSREDSCVFHFKVPPQCTLHQLPYYFRKNCVMSWHGWPEMLRLSERMQFGSHTTLQFFFYKQRGQRDHSGAKTPICYPWLILIIVFISSFLKKI